MTKSIGQTPLIMGILNVTPDSFSDGGQYIRLESAVNQAHKMVQQGAGIVDVGGESTRPGAQRCTADEQKRRVVPVVQAITKTLPNTLVSVDTTSSVVALASIQAGAGMLNDISAGREDPAMFELAAEQSMPICLMHMQNDPQTMQDKPSYEAVVSEVCDFLSKQAALAMHTGVKPENILLDPGIGFGKTYTHNVALLAHLDQVCALGFKVLLGASRKRFIADASLASEPSERVAGSCATTVMGFLQGVDVFRVHDVFEHMQALQVAMAVHPRDE